VSLEVIDCQSVNSNTNVDFVEKQTPIPAVGVLPGDHGYDSYDYDLTRNAVSRKDVYAIRETALSLMDTREMLQTIFQYLPLKVVLSSRRVCKTWHRMFAIKICRSSLSESRSDANIFPLFQRELFERQIGSFEHWVLFFVGEYRNYPLKYDLKLKSHHFYPDPAAFSIGQQAFYPQRTRYNAMTDDRKLIKHFQRLLPVFVFRRNEEITLHNILWSWLRGLKPLALEWLERYEVEHIQRDLSLFYKHLSSDYIEPECGSIPMLTNRSLTKFNYLSSILGLLTMNGDFEMVNRLIARIEDHPTLKLQTVFPRLHYTTHVYQHHHTFAFGYNVYGLCHLPLIDLALVLCDIPRSPCSLKVIRFVHQPHILVHIQSDLVLHRYCSGSILNVSLNRRIVLLKKLCFYFDLTATIHTSNLSRGNWTEYLVHSQLKKPFYGDMEPLCNSNGDADILSNFGFWARYMVLCHFKFMIRKYEGSCYGPAIRCYISSLFRERPNDIDDGLWSKLMELLERVRVICPEIASMVAIKGGESGHCAAIKEIEHYLRSQFDQYVAAIVMLDVIGAVYSDGNRHKLKSIERRGPQTPEEFESFRQCVLGSQQIRQFYLVRYDLEKLYAAINNLTFHDPVFMVDSDPNDRDTGIMAKHGADLPQVS